MTKHFRIVLAAVALFPGLAAAQDVCNFTTNSGRIANSYELVGVEACVTFCTETEDCNAWLYTPNTFNPEGAPGQCQLYTEVGDYTEPNSTASTQYCGKMDEG